MASFESPLCSSRASWMYTDPYAYQYSDISNTSNNQDSHSNDATGAEPSWGNTAGSTTTSTLCELEGSSPTNDTTTRYELPAEPVSREQSPTSSAPGSPFGLIRSKLTRSRRSLSSSLRRRVSPDSHTHAHAHAPPRSTSTPPQQPASAGLIPVLEEEGIIVASTEPCLSYVQPPPGYVDGLIPVDENATTPKEPSSDFDAILRNIGPISKKGNGWKKGRERGSRYYDRYESNFG
ncbi:hypothetical protein F4777DRAFT_65038 [Nemania sp. FL0916]|nr:hypothetical protein F4777DRAFT_65038 [Nemania sp. FL0916]